MASQAATQGWRGADFNILSSGISCTLAFLVPLILDFVNTYLSHYVGQPRFHC